MVEEKALGMVDNFATELYLRRFGGRLVHEWAIMDNWVHRSVSGEDSYHLVLFHR